MISFLALFPKSLDNELVDNYIFKLVGSFKQVAGFQSVKVSEGDLMSPGGPPAYSKVVEGSFDSLETYMGWVQSPWTQSPEAQAEKVHLIENGAILLFYEVSEL
jgi:hypothetical protein